jgi:hypothetical protein
MSQSLDQTNEPAPKNGGIQFYGGYQVYSESGIDLTLLQGNLELNPTERIQKGMSAARFGNELQQAGRALSKKQIMDRESNMIADLQFFLEQLARHQVDYVLIGGQAMRALGSAHVTDDLDICYARTPKNIAAVAAAMATCHPYLRGAPAGLPFRFDAPTIQAGLNFTLKTDKGDIDLLGEVSGIGNYDNAFAQSVELVLFGAKLRVLSVDGLIAAKKAAGRLKDRNHILELEELKKLRDAAP